MNEPGDKLASYSSLHLARAALEQKFPHHSAKVRQGNVTDTLLLKRYVEKSRQMRRLALELAQLEIDLKTRIGFDEAIDIPGEGILYWTRNSGRKRTKTNWMKMVQDFKIPEGKLKEYQRDEGYRRFYFRRRAVQGTTASQEGVAENVSKGVSTTRTIYSQTAEEFDGEL